MNKNNSYENNNGNAGKADWKQLKLLRDVRIYALNIIVEKEGGNYSENLRMEQKASCTGLIVGEALLTSTISYMVFAKVI